MKEKILAIEEIEFESNPGYESYSGYQISTEKQQIKIIISNILKCSERFGYFFCNDDVNDFIGADLLDIKITDTALNEVCLKKHTFKSGNVFFKNKEISIGDEYFEGGVMFVNLETSKGTLQFVAYNEQNGYYGHDAEIISSKLNYQTVI